MLIRDAINKDLPFIMLGSTSLVVTSGLANIVIKNRVCRATLKPAATIATLSVKMPLAPIDGQPLVISTTNTITSFTLTPNTSQTIFGSPVAFPLVRGSSVVYKWNAVDSTWYPESFQKIYNSVVSKTVAYTLTLADFTVLGDATNAALVFTLPTAASAFVNGEGVVYNLKKIDASANTVTIQGSGAELIDGINTKVISTQWTTVRIQSNGTSWFIL